MPIMGESTKRETTRADKRLETNPDREADDNAERGDTLLGDDSAANPDHPAPDRAAPENDAAPEDDPARMPGPASGALENLPWPSRLQEILIASAGATGAAFTASRLAGSGSDVETLETMALLFCGLAALSTWFLPLPKTNPRITRIGSWAAVAVALYWLGPIQIAEIRGAHDLAHGTRSEKEAALERLVRLGTRDLEGTDLRELNLSDADLTNLNLKNANLSHSTLERALLLETDLSESDLAGANFRGTNLSSAKLDGASFGVGGDRARCDRFTQLPKGYECLHGSITSSVPASK